MTGEVKRIDSIKNMAIFKDFTWSTYVKDKKGVTDDFKKINILYGRNYSGKTTLSRIFRAAETGSLSDKYEAPEFCLTLDGGATITQNSLLNHGQLFRVFNEDFVKYNLKFIIDESAPIESFAILGEDNARIEIEIAQCEGMLGRVEDASGLIGVKMKADEKYHISKKAHTEKLASLEDKLKNKANKAGTGIKYSRYFAVPTYNIDKIKADIQTVMSSGYKKISEEKAEELRKLLLSEEKIEIKALQPLNLTYESLSKTSKELIEKKIQVSSPIQELVNDSILEAWVRTGRDQHKKNNRETCAFCGSDLPKDIWVKLDNHFNKESEELRDAIDEAIKLIKEEERHVPVTLNINASDFYSQFSANVETLRSQYTSTAAKYLDSLKNLESQLEDRKKDIFAPQTFLPPEPVDTSLIELLDNYESLRKSSNQVTKSLAALQLAARTDLRLHEVFQFLDAINYRTECIEIEALRNAQSLCTSAKTQADENVEAERQKISTLKAQLKDESKGAERVNEYLNSYFGHRSLSLKAIENIANGVASGYRFEVIREGEKAFHMSEGECSLIAFCYFMAKLQDVDTKGGEPIIWIDDPISSLDSNHIFFIYSLINAEIVKPEEYMDNGQQKKRDKFKQLFISTHNLDFLKYLKRLPGADPKNEKTCKYLVINRMDQSSHLTTMPTYLQKYVTEFNYLFEQIYKCAAVEAVDDSNYAIFYNFGNNARKFFEIFLYYKYPDGCNETGKLERFFGGEPIPAILTDRINNEYSHLAGTFERGATPTEQPEMKSTARLILAKIQEADPHQFQALLESIGGSSSQLNMTIGP